MKRPLVLVGFTYLLTLAAAVYFGSVISSVLACFCLMIFNITLFIPRMRKTFIFPLAFLTASLAFGNFYAYYNFNIQPVKVLDGKDAVITGTVVEAPYKKYGRFYYIVKAKVISPTKMPNEIKLRISSTSTLKTEPFSKITGKVHFMLPKGGKGYSSQSYYASKGITMFAYLYNYKDYKVEPPAYKPIYYHALKLRSNLLKSVRMMYAPNEADIINSIIFGEKTNLSDEVYSDFRDIGISHIMSVSGLHMATMTQLLMTIFLFLRISKKISSVFTSLGVICFMAVTCFVPSVTRSGIMCLIYLSGIVLSRKPDSLNSLSIAALVICLINPFAAADIGFLLSCSATLGIILTSQKIYNYLNNKYDKIKKAGILIHGINRVLSTTLGATLFTLPIIIAVLGSISLIAPISNLLVLILSTFLLDFGAIAAVINLIFPHSFFALPFAASAGLIAKYMRNCAHFLAQIPYCSVPVSSGFVMLWLSCTIFLFAVTLCVMKNPRIFKVTAILSIIMLFTGILSNQLVSSNKTRLAVLDVGTDESIVITRNGRAAVIGCGGYSSYMTRNYLKDQGITGIDYIQPLTLDNKEAKNTAELMNLFKTKTLVSQNNMISDSFIRKELPDINNVECYNSSSVTNLWNNVLIHTQYSDNKSCVYIEVDKISVIICPEKTNISQIPKNWLNADFVVTDTFLDNLKSINCVCNVFSMDKVDLEKNYRKLRSLNPVFTGGAGNVVIEFNGNAMIKLRRE